LHLYFPFSSGRIRGSTINKTSIPFVYGTAFFY
jgi:hypothetical protein